MSDPVMLYQLRRKDIRTGEIEDLDLIAPLRPIVVEVIGRSHRDPGHEYFGHPVGYAADEGATR